MKHSRSANRPPAPKRFAYEVYGLRLESSFELPELESPREASALSPIVSISTANGHLRPEHAISWSRVVKDDSEQEWLKIGKVARDYLLRYPSLAEFTVSEDGARIECAALDPGEPATTLRHLLLDSVLPMALSLHGREALHATSVVTPRGICAFAGKPGAGKSTIAASFVTAGYELFCDDCLALDPSDPAMASPGYQGLRLWNDSLTALRLDRAEIDPVAGYTSKSRYAPARRAISVSRAPAKIAAIYSVLRDDDAAAASQIAIQPLSPREAIMELVSKAFRLDFSDRRVLSTQLSCFSRLARRVPVRSLRMPNDLSALPKVREAVLADLEEMNLKV